MTTIANKPRSVHSLAPEAATFGNVVISWPCTRRVRDARRGGPGLERVSCVLAVQPLDAQHAAFECWIESGGVRLRTVLHSTTRPCTITSDAAATHIDATAANGKRLLALSVDHTNQRIVYAQSTLLREAGFSGGTYDPPSLLATSDHSIAQSA